VDRTINFCYDLDGATGGVAIAGKIRYSAKKREAIK